MDKIMTMGEILVEIMAAQRGQTFREPGSLRGPYASGAPAIFIDQVARLGHPAGIIGCVGDDEFGLLNIERLEKVELYAKDSRVAILRDGTRLAVSRSGYARLRELL